MTGWPGTIQPGRTDTIDVPEEALDNVFEALAFLGVTFTVHVPLKEALQLLNELRM